MLRSKLDLWATEMVFRYLTRMKSATECSLTSSYIFNMIKIDDAYWPRPTSYDSYNSHAMRSIFCAGRANSLRRTDETMRNFGFTFNWTRKALAAVAPMTLFCRISDYEFKARGLPARIGTGIEYNVECMYERWNANRTDDLKLTGLNKVGVHRSCKCTQSEYTILSDIPVCLITINIQWLYK